MSTVTCTHLSTHTYTHLSTHTQIHTYSSNVNEVIRTVSNHFFFFYRKISHAQKGQKAQKAQKAQRRNQAKPQKCK